MTICGKCAKFGLNFSSNYSPDEYIEGNPKSPLWIVGINPANVLGWKDERCKEDLENYLNDMSKAHSYFKDFEKVSSKLYKMLKEGKAAHTDIIKCSSNAFAFKGKNKVIKNCQPYLKAQLVKYKPKLILCNGEPVCRSIQEIVKPLSFSLNGTSYSGKYFDSDISVVLSGFIGRIDDYAKARLGKELDHYIKILGI